jgi:hypothetical protein
MKLAFAIATVTALRQAPISSADCNFGSNYTRYFNRSEQWSFDIAVGIISSLKESNTISSGDTNVTTATDRRDMAIWKISEKDSTVQSVTQTSRLTLFTPHIPMEPHLRK